MEQLLKTLLALSLGGTALAALLLLLRRGLGRRIPSGFFYYAWLLVLLRFLLPVPGLLSVPAADRAETAPAAVWETPSPVAETMTSRRYGTMPEPAPSGAPEAAAPVPADDRTAVATAAGGTPADGAETEPISVGNTAAASISIGIWDILALVWAAGVLGFAGWYLTGYFRFRHALYRTVVPAKPEELAALAVLHAGPYPALCRSGAVKTPMLLGLLRPVIVLPDRDYTPEMLDGILRHELTHYTRGDLAYKWFAMAVFLLHWFNPFVYLFRREIDRACELSCDERLLRTMDRDQKQRYGELLLTLAAERPLPRGLVAMSFATEKRNLKERLMQIMTFKKKSRAALALTLAAALALAGCAVTVGPAVVEDAEAKRLRAEILTTPEPSVLPVGSETDWREQVRTWNPTATAAPEKRSEDVDVSDAPVLPRAEHFPEAYTVHTVDELLETLTLCGGSGLILLEEGVYNLSEASDYGDNTVSYQNYFWADTYVDGYELRLCDLQNLMILGAGADKTAIVTEPRYADVLSFWNCENLTLSNLTVGHTPEPGYCTGGVLDFNNSDDILVDNCDLFGCGTVGISAGNCRRVCADRTTIRECSYGAVWAEGCYDVRFTNGLVYDCGLKYDFSVPSLFQAVTTTGFTVCNSDIFDNSADLLLYSSYSVGTQLLGCQVYGNQFVDMLRITGANVRVEGCALNDNALVRNWYANYDGETPGFAYGADGVVLSGADLAAMRYAPYTGTPRVPPETAALPEPREREDGFLEYHVTTVDEFLSALGSKTVIYLDAEEFDLSTASSYGGYGGRHYYWLDTVDGPGLIITGVEQLQIYGMGRDKTTVLAQPRYADVLVFKDCWEVTVADLTAGHSAGSSDCAGDVLGFNNSADCLVSGCGLFGCGVNGIFASDCPNLTVADTEIYECSGYGAILNSCWNAAFENCDIHDCGYDSVALTGSSMDTVTWNGQNRTRAPQFLGEIGA